MWKRWSKSLNTNVIMSDESKGNKQTADPPDQAASDRGLSTTLGPKSDATNLSGSTQETVSDSPAKAEGDANPTPRVPIPQNMVHGSDNQSTAPVTYCTSSESASPISSSARMPRETIASGPAPIPPTIRAESRFPVQQPVSVETKSNDTFPYLPGTTFDTSALTNNTLLTPDPESFNLPSRRRRLSFRSLAFFYGRDKETTPTPSLNPTTLAPIAQTQEKSNSSNISQPKLSRAQKEALLSAITLQMLFIGPSPPSLFLETAISPKMKSHQSKFAPTPPLLSLKKVKAQLLKPESANAIISQLRRLPLPGGSSIHSPNCLNLQSIATLPDGGIGPIHAVCLPCTDEEAEKTYFSRLRSGHDPSSPLGPPPTTSSTTPNIVTASLESLISVFRDLHIVSLLASPDFGFGQPVSDNDNSGFLSGSVPSPGTLLDGFEEITKQLMMLGFATSKAVLPDHTGVYPPNDRISVLTYWWGLELVLPESSIQYLGKVKSISNTLLNFLSALALFNNGIREALPFVRYIANFVDFEWSAIQKQDKGRGVVCAATWVMPAAMVPRPWDFPSRPQAPPGSPVPPTSPASPKTSPSKDEAPTGGRDSPITPEHLDPSDPLYPATPAMPMMPQLLVTPATLPRNSHVPQQTSI